MSSTLTSSSNAMKLQRRALSSIPAMPTTRSLGSPLTSLATQAMASRGLETTMIYAFGLALTHSSVTALTILTFVANSSSRLIPGLRAMPAVMMMTSLSALSS